MLRKCMFEQVKELLGLFGLLEASSKSWALQMSGSLERRSNYSPDIWNISRAQQSAWISELFWKLLNGVSS